MARNLPLKKSFFLGPDAICKCGWHSLLGGLALIFCDDQRRFQRPLVLRHVFSDRRFRLPGKLLINWVIPGELVSGRCGVRSGFCELVGLLT